MMQTLRTGLVALTLAACGASGSAGGGTATTPGAAMTGDAAAAGLAAKLGISDKYVTMALSAAQAALGGGGQATADQKASAAQSGVDQAAAQAQTDGKPLSDDQKTGLLDGLKGLL